MAAIASASHRVEERMRDIISLEDFNNNPFYRDMREGGHVFVEDNSFTHRCGNGKQQKYAECVPATITSIRIRKDKVFIEYNIRRDNV